MINYAPPETVDFQQIVRCLRDLGLGTKGIAVRVGCSMPMIQQLANGRTRSCRYELGSKLIALHEQNCHKGIKG